MWMFKWQFANFSRRSRCYRRGEATALTDAQKAWEDVENSQARCANRHMHSARTPGSEVWLMHECIFHWRLTYRWQKSQNSSKPAKKVSANIFSTVTRVFLSLLLHFPDKTLACHALRMFKAALITSSALFIYSHNLKSQGPMQTQNKTLSTRGKKASWKVDDKRWGQSRKPGKAEKRQNGMRNAARKDNFTLRGGYAARNAKCRPTRRWDERAAAHRDKMLHKKASEGKNCAGCTF